jgi:hypothetical protein
MKCYHLILFSSLLIFVLLTGCRSGNAPVGDGNESDRAASIREDDVYEEYMDSVLVARGKYEDGKPEGLWTYWYTNGEMKAEGHYKDGLKNGMWIEWYDDGMLMWKGEWNMGTRTIQEPPGDAEIKFMGNREEGSLKRDSVYHLRIRVPNIPAELLFIEGENGIIRPERKPDRFICIPSAGESMKIIVGYYPDTAFTDFRNLVGEYEFNIH